MFAASHGSPGHAGHAFNPVQHGLEVGGGNREDAPAQAGSAMHDRARTTRSRAARAAADAPRSCVSHNFKQGVNSAIPKVTLFINTIPFKLSWRVAQLRTPHRARRARAGCGAACSPAVALVDLCPPIEHRLGSTIGSTRRAACSHIVRHGTASAKASPMRPRTLHRVLRAVGGWPI